MRNPFVLLLLSCCAALSAQTDSVSTTSAPMVNDSVMVDRTVYVEREFQPTIQAAGKIAMKPTIYEPQLVLREPVFSDWSSPLSIDYNMRKLDFSTLNFRQREPLHGFLRAGGGYANSLFTFNYRVTDSQMQVGKRAKKNTANDLILDLHADHLGQWGLKTLSQSDLGFDFSKQFNNAVLFFGAEGGNEYFSRYGVDTTATRLSHLNDSLRQSTWHADVHLGVRNVPAANLLYEARIGYESFIVPSFAIEHQIHTSGMVEWHTGAHHVGGDFDMQNRLYSFMTDTSAESNHRIHIEPYYAYEGERVRVHAGVNLDFSASHGRVAGISPNVAMEADLTRNWLALYALATGHYEANGAYGEYRENRYRSMNCLFLDSLSGEYTPIDMEVGFKIRPYATLLLNLHVGYAYTLDHHTNVFSQQAYGYYEHEAQNVSRWKIGADFHYHYRDAVLVQLSGNYFAHKAYSAIGGLEENFDQPTWEVRFRVDGKINQKWSLYSDNYFSGGRQACVYHAATNSYSAESLRPILDLNLGVQYNVNKWLSVYAQLNNYLAWTDKLSWQTWYGYEAQRANCMFGLTWSF